MGESETESKTDPAAEETIEAGRRLFAQPCRFVTAAADVEGLPPASLPEVAFAGRSNVGKSSLVNALVGQHALARTSNTPGRTQQLNFFSLGDRLLLVDLPGYGYAQAPKAKVSTWNRLIRDYLRGRPRLRRVVLLIDARHGVKASDEEIMTLLDQSALSFQVVLTKSDKLRSDALPVRLRDVEAGIRKHVAAHPDVIATSAVNAMGIAALRAELVALAAASGSEAFAS